MYEQTMQKNRQQELLTEEVCEVINYKPHWFVRKGNMIFLFVVLVLIALASVIGYPDIVQSRAKLTAVNPPKLINAKEEGKLVKLFVHNEQMVEQGNHLGYMESTASYNDVMVLKQWISESLVIVQDSSLDILVTRILPMLADLGELQLPYQEFQDKLEVARQTMGSGYYQLKKKALAMDIHYSGKLKQNTRQQKDIEEQNWKMLQQEYDAYEKLANEKVIAPLELNQYKSKLLAKQQNLQQLEAVSTNNDISSLSKQKELIDIDKQRADIRQQLRSGLYELKSQIELWIKQYVLIAPEPGKVFFVSTLKENQLITAGQGLLYIQPPQSEYYVEMMAAQKGLGKISEGQTVILKVDGYPSEEFGHLTAKVDYISPIPSRTDSFMVKAELLTGLETNYHRSIFFRNDLTADAQIITDKRKLIERLTGQFRTILQR